MKADDDLDLSVLTWVKGELDATLGQARQALEAFVEDPQDTGQLGFCVAYIHQVYGTLQMLELYGASMLAEEMEALARALQDNEATRRDETFEVLMRAMLQLPDYLERLQAGQRDVPLALLPLVNDLRAARGLNLLSENALFVPDLSGLVTLKPSETVQPAAAGDLAATARRLRPAYQKALLGWLRTHRQKESLAEMSRVIVTLEHASTLGPVVQLWWVAGGLFEALAEGGLKASVSLNQVLGQIDREIKRLIDEGELALAEKPATELLKNLLYYLAQAESGGERVQAVQDAFKLKDALPDAEEVEAARAGMTGHNLSLMETVGQALNEDLSTIKDGLDLFIRSDRRDVAELASLSEHLKRVADTLGMLGLGVQRQMVQDKSRQLAAMAAGEQAVDDDAVMEIAQALLVIELAVDDLSSAGEQVEEEQPEAGGMQLPAAEFEQVRLTAAREALTDLHQAQNDIMAFIDTPWGHEQLSGLPDIIRRVRGSLQMLGLERAAGVLRAVANYIEHELIERKLIPEPQALDHLADAITAVEYFLEALVERNRMPGSVLELATRSAQALGYAPHTESLGPDIGFEEPETPAPPEGDATSSMSVSEELGDEILQIFIEEAEEEIGVIQDMLPRWRQDLEDEEALTRMRRAFHTLKGSGRLVGASEIGEFAWAFEKLLNRVIEHTLEVDDALLALLAEGVAALPSLLEKLQGGNEPSIDIHELESRAHAAAEAGKAPAPAAQPAQPPISLDPTLAGIFIKESQGHLAELDAAIEKCRAQAGPCLPGEPVVRALHTLHGSARMANVDPVAELGNALEKCLKEMLARERPLDEQILGLAESAASALRGILAAINVPGAILPDYVSLQQDIEAYRAALQGSEAIGAEAGVTSEDDLELLQVFLEEGADILDGSEHILRSWREDPGNRKPAARMRRELHTLKGSARMAGLTVLGDFSHAMEKLLAAIAEGRRESSAPVLEVLQRGLERLHALLEQARERQPLEPPREALEEIEAVMRGEAPASPVVGEAPAEPVAEPEEDDFQAELREIFLEEGGDILEDSEQLLQQWRERPNDLALVVRLQREVHTLKGSARMAELPVIGDFSHALENLLEAIAEGRCEATDRVLGMLQRCFDQLHVMLEQTRNHQPLQPPQGLTDEIETAMRGGVPETGAVEEIVIEAPGETALPEEAPETGPEIAETGEDEDDFQAELREIFLEEGAEILDGCDQVMQAWRDAPHDLAVVARLQREVHTLKGSARMAGLAVIGDFSHALEDLLTAIAEGRRPSTSMAVELLQRALDRLHSLLERAGQGQPLAVPEDLLDALRQLPEIEEEAGRVVDDEALAGIEVEASGVAVESEEAGEETAAGEIRIEAAAADVDEAVAPELAEATPAEPPAEAERPAGQEPAVARTGQETMRVRADLIDDLVNYAGEVSIYRARLEQQIGSFGYNLAELDQTVTRLREQLRKLELETEAQILHRFEETRSDYDEDFDPLEMDRYSTIQQLSRALNESANDLISLQNLMENTVGEAETLLLQQSRVNTELQEGLMRSRMVPFTGLATRLRRLVRQTAEAMDKQVELHIHGGEGEMDRKILDRITAPLEHMLRNAVAHGIGTPAQRQAAGKPAHGRIDITLSREGSEIVLKISDDGQGIDIEAIRRTATARGLLAAGARIPDQDIMLFILESGFSTASEVTQVAGRGVGMDVVNSEVKQLGGSLDIASEKGRGTTFTIRLPLTLAINRALLVHAGEDNYAIPLTSIEGVVRIDGDELQTLLEDAEGRYRYHDQNYRVYRLGELLGAHVQPLDARRRHPVLLIRYGEQRAAIQVDGLLGSREIVVKSIGAQLSTVQGLSGATILGDGSVVLILDMGALLHHGLARSWAMAEAEPEPEAEAESEETTVMVVDDSITIRKVTSRLLERKGFRVLTAKDGVDAVALLQEQRPDIFLLDIEMPRMDGYELAAHIRNEARLKDIPIIMITSRTGEKHRQRAFDIGVDRYLGKPYTETDLMQNIDELLALEKNGDPA